MMTLLIHRIQEIVMKKLFKEALEDSPIIAAVKDDEGLSRCLTSDSRIIFILYGDIVTISDIVETVKSAGKLAIVHLDLINGLSSKEVAVDFLQKYTNADGIITTKPTLIKRAKELGLFTILRLFLIDSMAYENIDRQVKSSRPDLIEILPALMPKVIAKVCHTGHCRRAGLRKGRHPRSFGCRRDQYLLHKRENLVFISTPLLHVL